ncbi:MAG: sortase [Acidimicrobiales bacterium]
MGLCVLSTTLLLQLLMVSAVQQRAAQERSFASFRAELAAGTAPIGPIDADGRVLAPGTSVAYLEIPSIGVGQVVGEGTTPGTLFDGPGHRRDSPLPGQVGTSVVLGRRGAFGGPFARLDDLQEGDLIRVTTGQGIFDFAVSGIRSEGDPAPPPAAAGEGRLLLATAGGRPFLPTGVLRVDAELEEGAVSGARPLVATPNLPQSERIMGADTSTLWALVLWLQCLVVLAVGAVWAWHRWGHARAWLAFAPPLALVGLSASGEAARLLPNML